MEAYHLDRASSLTGPGAPYGAATAPPGAEAAPAPEPGMQGVENARLVTGLVEQVDAGELKQALVGAGARSIIVSDAHVYPGQPGSQVVRGYRRAPEFDDRLRVEVLVEEEKVEPVLEALDRLSPRWQGDFVQVAEPRRSPRSAAIQRDLPKHQ